MKTPYYLIDEELLEKNLKMCIRDRDIYELPPKVRLEITNNLRQEMIEIYSGSNIF